MCWRLSSRWRQENYFRYARTRFALDALDSRAATPDDPERLIPDLAKKTAAAQVRCAADLAEAAGATRDARLPELRSPPPGTTSIITSQALNRINAPAETAWRELEEAEQAAAAIPARILNAREVCSWRA